MAIPLMGERREKTTKHDFHTVDERSAWIAEDEELHELAYSLREGVRAMRRHAMSGRYMKPNPGELEVVQLGDEGTYSVSVDGVEYSSRSSSSYGTYSAYDLRVQRSTMPNPWTRTIRSAARLPFRSRIQLDGWEEELQGIERLDKKTGKLVVKLPGWVADIDGEGRSLDQWCAESFEDSMFEGVVYAFIDNDPRTFTDQNSRRLAGARPYVAKLHRCDIRRLSIGISPGGTPRLLQLVFDQPMHVQDFSDPNAWVDTMRPALKVVTAGTKTIDPETGVATTTPITTRVYVDDGEGNFIHEPEMDGAIIPEGGNELIDIPLVPLYGKRVGPWRGHSPYIGDSAETQVSIWNHQSELLNKARETALSYLFETGLPNDDGSSGGNAIPVDAAKQSLRYRGSTDAAADLKFVEQSGSSLHALKDIVEWLVGQVEKEHHAITSDKQTQPVTAREITLEGVHATSFLEMATIFHEHGWQKILELMATLGGHRKTGTVWISKNFGLPNTAMERNSRMCLGDKMTRGNYWTTALAAGEVNEEDGFDLEAEINAESADSDMRELLRNIEVPLPPDDEGEDQDDEGTAGPAMMRSDAEDDAETIPEPDA